MTKPHEERVHSERKELKDKLDKLGKFIGNNTYLELQQDDQILLVEQSQHMSKYLTVLDRRIARFSND